MERFFNTEGPVRADDNYCLPPLGRPDLDDLLSLIGRKRYFILHAPRQTGKTTCLLALMEHLNREARYRCLYVNFEKAQSAREDVHAAMHAMLGEIGMRARDSLGDPLPLSIVKDSLDRFGTHGALDGLLTTWAQSSSIPIVLLIDEIDALIGDTEDLQKESADKGTHYPILGDVDGTASTPFHALLPRCSSGHGWRAIASEWLFRHIALTTISWRPTSPDISRM